MKNLILFSIAFTFSIFTNYAQPFNKEIVQEGKTPILLGKINKEALSENTYSKWFLTNYKAYQPNKEKIAELKKILPEYTITAFFGTWCDDSKKYIPVFYKILDAADFPLERLTVIALSNENKYYKQSPGGEEEGLNIHRVPTFIFYKDGKEINRIVEHPVENIETDMLQLLTKEYHNFYYGVTLANEELESLGTKKFIKNSKKISFKIAPFINSKYDLNTFCKVLLAKDKKEEAVAIAYLNTQIFPSEISVYETLANIQGLANKKADAIVNYKKALKIDPEREDLKSLMSLFEKDLKNEKK